MSLHTVLVGAPGTGKTTFLEYCIRQLINRRKGCCLIDPTGALYQRLLDYCCYLRGVGRRVPELILFNPSDGQWLLPFNPFLRKEGDISVQVDRRVTAVLRAWKQHSGDETPRLEKWLKLLFNVLIEQGLTILEAENLLSQEATPLRLYMLEKVQDPYIRRRLLSLSAYRVRDFLEQTESAENRLMRFLSSETMRRIMGPGPNALDFASIMDEGKIVLVNLRPSQWLSSEQRRLLGSLILTEAFETAQTRISGARPFYMCVDEAAEFMTPELAQALEQCRQKGLHFTLSFQHLSQFHDHGLRTYKAVKNAARNKFVFAIPDRQDAQELADDLVRDLAQPNIKYVRRHLTHLIEDVRDKSYSRTVTRSSGRSSNTSHTDTRGEAFTDGSSSSYSHSFGEQESEGYGQSESQSFAHQTGSFSGESRGRFGSDSTSRGDSLSTLDTFESDVRRTRSSGHSSTFGDSHAQSSGESESDTETQGSSRSVSLSRGFIKNWSATDGQQNSFSESSSVSDSYGETQNSGQSVSCSVTEQPSTKHTPLWEEEPVLWTLEEQRWRASESLIHQGVGQFFMSGESACGFGTFPKPSRFFIRQRVKERYSESFYQRHNLPVGEAEQLTSKRQHALRTSASAFVQRTAAERRAPEVDGKKGAAHAKLTADGGLWNRRAPDVVKEGASRHKRGPKADVESHRRVAELLASKGESWTEEEALWEICEQLDELGVRPPKAHRPVDRANSWVAALISKRARVVQALIDHRRAVKRQAPPGQGI